MLPQRAPTPTEQESVGSLVSRLADDVTRIVRAEMALVQARAAAVAGAVRAAGAMLAAGIVLMLGGLGALVAAVVLVVAQWLLPWVAALLVGSGFMILGIILLAMQGRVLSNGIREALTDVSIEVEGGRRGD